MKYLLVAINASFSHTNLAVRTLKEYVSLNLKNNAEFGMWNSELVDFVEFTINQPVGEILRGIAASGADVVLFSTYIWNGEITAKIIPDVKKLLPGAIVGAGGPEFGYAAEIYLKKLPALDFVIFGEGEEALFQLVKSNCNYQEVQGLFYRNSEGKTLYTGDRDLLCDLSKIPFPYPEITEPDNKMYYYESSRGCPFSCSYCMSSLDKRVRFMPLERVYSDLQRFLDANVRIVKFVDRTYNLQPERYINIWRYILEHHNGKTMFHFEIEAEFLSEEALEFLQTVPAGVMQFEIGVQSSNKKTLKAINRSQNIEKLAENIKHIPRTIHQHLDLIAALPYEDLESFGHSFDFVASLKPDALQLGFLKVLHGTIMEQYAKENGWQWMENPVYEAFSTPYLSYEDIIFLKDLEVTVDAYWNSGKFTGFMNYIFRTQRPWNFFCQMVDFGRKNKTFEAARRETYWFELLYKKLEEGGKTSGIEYELLRYDFVKRGKQGGFPGWYRHNYDKDAHRRMLEAFEHGNHLNSRVGFASSEYEVFSFDVEQELPENYPGVFEKLIRYIHP